MVYFILAPLRLSQTLLPDLGPDGLIDFFLPEDGVLRPFQDGVKYIDKRSDGD